MTHTLRDAALRLSKGDREGFKRFVEAFESDYRERLDAWVKGDTTALERNQGAALAYLTLLGILKEVLSAS